MPKEKLFDTEVALEKAMELFWKKGYNGTSINDLVDATGLSRSSLYSIYVDKHQLYVRALKHYQTINGKSLAEELTKSKSAIKKLEALFRLTIKTIMLESHGKGCFMINTVTEMANQDKGLSRIAHDDFAGMEELFLKIVKEGQKDGEISKDHKATALAQYFFNSYLGLRVMGQTNSDKTKLEETIQTILTIVK